MTKQISNFRQKSVISSAELKSKFPSIFADTAHESRSERFRPIQTIEVLKSFKDSGFMPIAASQSYTREGNAKIHARHSLRLRHIDENRTYNKGGNVFEIALKNANDGTSGMIVAPGIYRIVCDNGMVVKSSEFSAYSIRHTGDPELIHQNITKTVQLIMANAKNVMDKIDDWKQVELSRMKQLDFVERAHALRFDDNENGGTFIDPAVLLNPRRTADAGKDLWSIFNIVQENLTRGGMKFEYRNEYNHLKRNTIRPVKSVDIDFKLNSNLWELAEEYA